MIHHIDITTIKGIGPHKAHILRSEAGIATVEDFLYYMPRKYIDRSLFKKIKDCKINELVTISGTITNVDMAGFKKKYLEVVISDGTGFISGVFFGGISYFKKIFNIDDTVIFSGTTSYFKKLQISHPDFDFIDNSSSLASINTGRIIPLYKSSENLKKIGFDSRGFRRAIKTIFDNYLHMVTEPLEIKLLKKYKLLPLRDAIMGIHFPESFEQSEQARKRLAFNEIFFMHFYLALSKKFISLHYAATKPANHAPLLTTYTPNIPFELTADQLKAIEEIKNDILAPLPMNRLLQGDVGSGKTIVALYVSLFSISLGNQVALMVPTEVLANQHFANFKKIIPESLKIALLTKNVSKKERTAILENLVNGNVQLIIGTHALIQDDVFFKNLGLIIIDEQHRFGVDQRVKLRNKGADTDLLVMTATPIPRSLTLTLYGDLEVSYLKTKPAFRHPITTLAFTESRLKGVYNSIEKYVTEGRQVYYVLPLIEESEKIDLESAVAVFNKLRTNIFPHLKVALLHGKLKNEEKDLIMQQFNEHKIDILVTTTVIEVGIDVANASIIIIHHAERFGLAQLHQLRGRVGRGPYKSFCILIHPDDISELSKKRIAVLLTTNDGFIISEEDLKLRGSGEVIGTRQHGHSGGFEFIDLALDLELIINLKQEAKDYIETCSDVELLLNTYKSGKFDSIISGIRKKRVLEILS